MWNIACVMKIAGKIFIFLIIFFIVMSCSMPNNRYELLNMRTSDSLLFMETPDTLPDGIIDSVYWIPLQDSGQKVLYEISKLCVTDSFIIVGNRYQGVLQVYSADGRFLYDISRKGQGPEEYLGKDRDRRSILKLPHLQRLLPLYIFLTTILMKCHVIR